MNRYSLTRPACLALTLLAVAGCSTTPAPSRAMTPDPQPAMAARPLGAGAAGSGSAVRAGPKDPPCDLGVPGAICRGTATASIIDTRTFVPQIQEPQGVALRRVREVLPPHETPGGLFPQGEGNGLTAGVVLPEPRTAIQQTWPSIGATGWNPPDPTLAVGPNHVIATVNMQISFYSKAGVQQFSLPLNDTGNPGFFESVGARGYTFDPKCFYDHIAQRFVVVAPEVYTGTNEAYICIAVSDDSDPNGVWYKYRTDAALTIGTNLYWWDYPGFGYDGQAYYVTSNLFPMSTGGFGGAGFRIFNKTPMLTGAPATYSTLVDAGAASVQVAQHFGTPAAPLFVSTGSSTQIRVRAITNPLTTPAIVTTNVTVPAYSGPSGAPTPTGAVSTVDARIMNACWRNGNLYAAHTISSGGKNQARWYHIATGTWPTSGACTLVQSGNVDGGGPNHTIFPAIYSNAANDVGMVLGVSSVDSFPAVAVTGRRSTDPLGRMGAPEIVKLGEASATGRWGDYFDMAVDPTDDTTFWCIGEYARSSGWNNWITSFLVTDDPTCHPLPDDAGAVTAGAVRLLDVLANDWHSTGLTMTIDSFPGLSQHGGALVRSVGTGPGGRDQIRYTVPAGYNGYDTFTYTVRDSAGSTATSFVSAFVTDPATFRQPENPTGTSAGVNVAYYALSAPTVLPNFDALVPYAHDVAADINIAATSGVFATSGRTDNLGAVYEGYINVTASGYYTLATTSDDGSKLYLGSTLLVNNDGAHGMREVWAPIGLAAGRHRVRVEFFEGGGDCGLIVSMGLYTGSRAVVPAAQWSRVRCDPDVNHDGNVDQDDVAYVINVVGGGPNPTGIDPDFNHDGNVDQDDVAAIVAVVAGAPCP